MVAEVKINVMNVVGYRLCVSSEDGQKLFDTINKNFQENKKVELSFQGITNLTSAFLNTAVGQLYGKYPESFVRANLSVSHMEKDDLVILKRVVERAKDYFKNPKPYEKAVNDLIGGGNE
ncbi:STAS-like domain-containing protein [Methanosarcina mazei]|uniref:DUF4325 domain-containing protein n=1 Tax=Methanosarcina mazei TaxID=2209 RepID=A0A0F8RHK0_METMZ|nr:STAS-like domain-containing protein [Methanosarcina mazei]KKG06145.1 hypothetical protein DU47_12870 [Methanosarcina mazei]KKH86887.1 hypothetical protein DU80_07085 [Methanosarcina mazei]